MKTTRLSWCKWAALLAVFAMVLTACGSRPEAIPQNQGSQTGNQGGAANSSGQGGQDQTSGPNGQAGQSAPKQWSEPPKMTIDQNKTYQAELTTSKGKITIELFPKDAPVAVNNFVFLARQGFYDGVTFHRIIRTFMIQTGDPTGTGMGGPGYTIQEEKTKYQYEPGIVAMAKTRQPHSTGSQFFICTGEDSKNLNRQPDYTIFGKVTDGMDVVQEIAATPTTTNPQNPMDGASTPTEKVTIDSVKIIEK